MNQYSTVAEYILADSPKNSQQPQTLDGLTRNLDQIEVDLVQLSLRVDLVIVSLGKIQEELLLLLVSVRER